MIKKHLVIVTLFIVSIAQKLIRCNPVTTLVVSGEWCVVSVECGVWSVVSGL